MKRFIVFFALLLFVFVSCTTVSNTYSTETKSTTVEYREFPAYTNWENFLSAYEKETTVSYSELESDLDDFVYLLSTSYAGYEEAKSRGMNEVECISAIKERFASYSEIQSEDIANAIYEKFSPYVLDGHFALITSSSKKYFTAGNRIYFSSVYVEKNKNGFIVTESQDENVKMGSVLSVRQENLFSYPAKSNKTFRIGAISKDDLSFIEAKSNDETVRIALKQNKTTDIDKGIFSKVETDKSIYLKITDFENEKNGKAFVEAREEAVKKDFVIIDVRGNSGGDNAYIAAFYKPFYTWKKTVFSKRPYIDNVFYDSPAGVVGMANFIKDSIGADENSEVYDDFRFIFELSEAQKQNPHRAVIKNSYGGEKYKFVPSTSFKGKIIVLTDRNTASSGEDAIHNIIDVYLKAKRLISVGENTAGAMEYGNVSAVILPNSHIVVSIPIADFSDGMKYDTSYHGDGNGYYPDYWCEEKDIAKTVYALTKDKELFEHLEMLF